MKLRATYETETYISAGGHYAIRQVNSLDEEAIVCLSPDQMRLLVADMQEHLKDIGWWADAVEEE